MIGFWSVVQKKQTMPQRCTGFLSERADAHCFHAVDAYGTMVTDKLSVHPINSRCSLMTGEKSANEKPNTFTFLDLNAHLCYTHVFLPSGNK